MAKVTSFNKANIKSFRADLEAALAEVGKKFGVKIDLGNIRYNESSFKSELAVVIDSGVVSDPVMNDVPAVYINELLKWRGKAALKKAVKIGGNDAIIVGIKGKAYVFKWTPGTPMAAQKPGLYRQPFRDYDVLDMQVRAGLV